MTLNEITSLPADTSAPDPAEVRGRIRWGADSFGKANCAVFIGDICAGHVMEHYARTKQGLPAWRAWIMRKDDDGEDLGWFDTDDLARAALVAAVREAIGRTD